MHSEWIFNQIETLNIKKKINLLDFASGDGRNCIPLSKKNIIINKLRKYGFRSNDLINTVNFILNRSY